MPSQSLDALIVLLGAAMLVALLDAVPGLDFVLQMAGAGGLVGTALAYLIKRRHPDADAWPIVARWMLLLAAIAVVIQLVIAVLSGR